jgi:hypothetical protein
MDYPLAAAQARTTLPTRTRPTEHYGHQKNPGGAYPPKNDIGPNDAIHGGKPKKRPPPRPGAPS